MRPNVSKSNVQYQPQTGLYKVFVKDKSVWRGHDAARLQISVGNPKHTGDKFFALTEWAAARFDKVVLIVSDTLQRYNIALQHGVGLDEAYQISVLNGQRWLRENRRALDNLSAAQKVLTTWDDWMSHPDYAATRQEINSLYGASAALRDVTAAMARNFCLRSGGEDAITQSRDFETSVNYLLEEFAAFAVMFRERRAVDVYPGLWFREVFDVIAGMETSELMSGFSNVDCVRVDFTRNKAFQQPEPGNSF